MISVKKLYTLKTGTRLRKIVRILEEWERELLDGREPDAPYLKDLSVRMREDKDLSEKVLSAVRDIECRWNPNDLILCRRLVNSLRHLVLVQLDVSQADWDFIHPGDRREKGDRSYFEGVSVYLDEIRSPFNVGSIFRTAESLGVEKILLSPGTADPRHPRALRTSMGCVDRIPWNRMDYSELSGHKRNMFALELGGVSVHQFGFPASGILVLGSEEVGVSLECLNLADQSLGRASIPLYGWKGSLNVSVAYGIIMSLWAQSLSV